MHNVNDLPSLVERFFAQWLMAERRLSFCTIASYRDTFRLLLNYLHTQTQRPPAQQRLEDWDAPNILRFLEHLEKNRKCCVRSRNARLAAIHGFMKFVAKQHPEFLGVANRVLAIPTKRHEQPLLGYLTVEELNAILQAPDLTTWSGQRDQLLFQLLYNTGARVSEVVALNRQDLPADCQGILLHGKGRKQRTVPLWKKTAKQIRRWLDQQPAEPSAPVFTNHSGCRLSRFGVQKRLAQAAAKAAQVCPSLKGRQVSPHIVRHTTAMHLLQSGVDITAIALWLGHESPLTTHKYIEADLQMKLDTLSRLKEPQTKPLTYRPGDSLLAFLEAL